MIIHDHMQARNLSSRILKFTLLSKSINYSHYPSCKRGGALSRRDKGTKDGAIPLAGNKPKHVCKNCLPMET